MTVHYVLAALFYALFEGLLEVLFSAPYLQSKKNIKFSIAVLVIFMFIHNGFFSVFGEYVSAYVIAAEVVAFYSLFAVFVRYAFEGKLIYNYCMIFAYRHLFRIAGTVLTFVPILMINGFDPDKAVKWVNSAGAGSFMVFLFSFPVIYLLLWPVIRWIQRKERRGIILLFMALTVLDLITTVNTGTNSIIMLPLIMIGVFVSAFFMQRADDAEIRKNYEYYNEMLRKTEEQEVKISVLRHDIANHLSAVSRLEAEENDDGISDIYEHLEKTKHKWTGVPILDCLLAEKKWVAGKKGIDFDISSIRFSLDNKAQVNLVSMLSNLIDNAFDACERVMDSSSTPAKCGLTIDNSEDYLRITVENDKPVDEKPVKTGFATLKKDKENHGYGHRILKGIVSEMEGQIFYEDRGTVFMTRALVKIQQETI